MYAIKIFYDFLGKYSSSSSIGYFIGFYICQGEPYISYAHKDEPNSKYIKLYKSKKRAENAIERIKYKANVKDYRYEIEEWK